jgi:hypothetical protein
MLKYKFYWNAHKLLQLQNIKFAPVTECIWHNFYLENLHFTVEF